MGGLDMYSDFQIGDPIVEIDPAVIYKLLVQVCFQCLSLFNRFDAKRIRVEARNTKIIGAHAQSKY